VQYKQEKRKKSLESWELCPIPTAVPTERSRLPVFPRVMSSRVLGYIRVTIDRQTDRKPIPESHAFTASWKTETATERHAFTATRLSRGQEASPVRDSVAKRF
jgi:hypothetical protein